MSARRRIFVTLEGRTALVSGWNARELIQGVTGRPPMRVPTRKAWDCRASTARDVIAHAERLGYEVFVTGVAPETSPPAADVPPVASGEHHTEPEDGLW